MGKIRERQACGVGKSRCAGDHGHGQVDQRRRRDLVEAGLDDHPQQAALQRTQGDGHERIDLHFARHQRAGDKRKAAGGAGQKSSSLGQCRQRQCRCAPVALNPVQNSPYGTLRAEIFEENNEMRNLMTTLLAALAAAFLLTACQSEDNGGDNGNEIEQAEQAVEEAREGAEDMMAAAQSEAQKAWQEAVQLANEANMKARQMMNSGMERGSEAWDEAMEETRETREQAQQALEDAREYSGEQWDSFSARAQAVMDEASRAWNELTEEGESGSDADDSGNT